MDKTDKIEISSLSIIKVLAIIIGLWLVYLLREVAVLLFVVVIIVTALDPAVNWAQQYKIPRALSTALIYLLILIVLSLMIYLLIPPLVAEISNFAHTLPSYTHQFGMIYQFVIDSSSYWQGSLETITKQLSNLTGGLYNATIAIFGGVASALTILVLSFYSLADKNGLNQFLLSFIPEKNRHLIVSISSKIADKLGSWLRGQVAISLIMGLIVSLLLTLVGIPFALTIGLVAALLEIIPIIGAVVTAILAVGVALIYGSWLKAIIVLAVFLVIQQLESHYLIPKIMSKAVGLSPVIIIVALLVGGTLGGILGAILAIPLTAALVVTIQELQKKHAD